MADNFKIYDYDRIVNNDYETFEYNRRRRPHERLRQLRFEQTLHNRSATVLRGWSTARPTFSGSVKLPPVDSVRFQSPTSYSTLYLSLTPIFLTLLILLPLLCYIVIKMIRERKAVSVRRHQPEGTRASQPARTRHTQQSASRRRCGSYFCGLTVRRTQQLQRRNFDNESLISIISEYMDVNSELSSAPLSRHNDMPPPYSECHSEEPPPPYSACCIIYTRSEDAKPREHIHRQSVRHERPHSSTDMDNAQNNLIENGLRGETDTMTTRSNANEVVAPGMRPGLFDNGRIVERPSGVLKRNNNDTAVAINDHVEEQSTRHAECNDRVVYIDETVAENTSRGELTSIETVHDTECRSSDLYDRL